MTTPRKTRAPRSRSDKGRSGGVPGVERINRTRLVDGVTEQLRELILAGEIAPGTQLLQIELAERLGVSRTPLREAFRVIERDGLVRMANGNRTIEVIDPDPVDLLELYEVREVLDGLAASLCAKQGLSPVQLAHLEALMGKMEGMSMPNESNAYTRMHAEFHLAITAASSNRRLENITSLLINTSSQKSLLRHIKAHQPDRLEELEQFMGDLVSEDDTDHRELVDAITAQGSKQAETIARRHVRRSIALVRRFLPAP